MHLWGVPKGLVPWLLLLQEPGERRGNSVSPRTAPCAPGQDEGQERSLPVLPTVQQVGGQRQVGAPTQRNQLWEMVPPPELWPRAPAHGLAGATPQLTPGGRGPSWAGAPHTAPAATGVRAAVPCTPWATTRPPWHGSSHGGGHRSPVTHPPDTLTQLSCWFPAIAANGSHLGNGSGDAARRADERTACSELDGTRPPRQDPREPRHREQP